MFKVYDKNMNRKQFPKGVRPLDIFISSIQKNTNNKTIEGRPGIITYGNTHGTRPIEIKLLLEAQDTRDYRLLRDAVFSFFDEDEFYISEQYVSGKRYKVNVVESYIPERMNFYLATARFFLDITELPYAESIGTTQDIQRNGIDADSELWGFGMGLIADDESLIYTHETNEFRIYNAGNRPIHPFQQELKITISDIGIEPSRNMFDGTYNDWFIYDYSDTAYLRRNYQGEEYTLMIPVDSGQTYTIKVHDKENSNQFTIATAPTEPVFDGAGIFDMGRPVHLQGKFSHQERTYTLTIPEGDNYLYVMAAQDQEPPSKIQVEQGDTATPYKPHPSEDQFIELRNKTNNTRFKSTDTFANEDIIIIHGPNVTKNSQAYLRKTTKEFIELLPGWNEFEVTGVSNAKIEFDFRFYYA
ncbi:phage tail domain-containing protein [Virgibacillus salexigens]|uniref:phage tail domain-containing protein n=1 Tax=Virgibacillus salexigens TaxID=61016 RepID=UPI00190BEAED|nr:phage tail domain-containing protein [Virgibacillus salexigens]